MAQLISLSVVSLQAEVIRVWGYVELQLVSARLSAYVRDQQLQTINTSSRKPMARLMKCRRNMHEFNVTHFASFSEIYCYKTK